jgi:general secretion pathway protein M
MLSWRPSNSRTMALALLVLLSFAIAKLIVAPLLTAYPEVALRIEHSQALLNRYRALSAQRPRLSARLRAAKNAVADNTAYLKGGPSDTLAGAALQNQVRSIVEGVGGVLRSSQLLPLETVEPEIFVRRVGLRLEVQVAMERLRDMLYELETTQPWVFVKEMTISRGKVGELGGVAGINTMLEMRIEIYGFLL